MDLGCSPSTNTLPIRRLGLAVGTSKTIQAAWITFPELRVQKAAQTYTRLDEVTYRYASGTFVGELDRRRRGARRRLRGVAADRRRPRAGCDGASSTTGATSGSPGAPVHAFLLSFGVVFVAELGDKSQLMALTFATRYRPLTVLIGITIATAVVHAVSVRSVRFGSPCRRAGSLVPRSRSSASAHGRCAATR